MDKALILGTAQWGWTVDQTEAFRILEHWYQTGQRAVDTATNYPINRNPADFRAAERILLEFIRTHGITDLKVTVKIGSIDNLRSPENNLTESFLLMMAEEYLRLFGENLSGIMLHWDNRNAAADIDSSLTALQTLQERYGLQPGLSGIANPEQYAAQNAQHGLHFHIQVKHNIFQSDLGRYKAFYGGGHRFYAYGINAGGVKLDGDYRQDSTFAVRGGQAEKMENQLAVLRNLIPEWTIASVRPPIRRMSHIGLLYAGLDPMIDGLVLGASTKAQIAETLDFWRNLAVFDYTDVWKRLQQLA